MNTPFRPLSMILMAVNEMMSNETSKPVDLSNNPSWAQNIVDKAQQEHDL